MGSPTASTHLRMADPSAPAPPAAQFASPPFPIKYTKLFIDGEFVDASSKRTFETLDPRTGQLIANVAEADKEDVDIAVKAARKAFDEGPWPRMTGYQRGRILSNYADLIEQHTEQLAALETLDNGKPILMSTHFDIPGAVKALRSTAGWGDKITGSTYKMDGPYQAMSLYEPIGVVGAVIPWNFPICMFLAKAAPALTAGCAVVLKPAEQTPLTALYLASLAKEAGIPPGVLNVIPGFGETAGAALSSHVDVDKITFTGSTQVGRIILEAAAKSNLKPVTLELGGKSPLIICDDADIDIAVELAHLATFYNMGQICIAGSRVFVQEGIHDEFLRKMAERAKKQVIGDPFKMEVNHGPQVSQAQLDTVLSYIKSGKDEGARVVAGGNRVGNQGYFVDPTVFADVQDDMKIAKEEIFGPVMSVLKFKTLDEVVERSNATRYGLASGIVTKDIDVANRLSRSIKSGVVWVNCYLVLDPVLPFGGYKMSGLGRELGIQGVLNFMQLKAVVTPLQNSPWL